MKMTHFTGFNLAIDPDPPRKGATASGVPSRSCSDSLGKIATSCDSVICLKQVKFTSAFPSHPQQQHYPKYRKYLLYGNRVLCCLKFGRHWITKQTTKSLLNNPELCSCSGDKSPKEGSGPLYLLRYLAEDHFSPFWHGTQRDWQSVEHTTGNIT